MIGLMYFDWNGSSKELEAYCKKFSKACEKHGVTYKGNFSPPQEKWNYAIVLESEHVTPNDYNVFNGPFRDAGGKSPNMGHIIMKYLVATGM